MQQRYRALDIDADAETGVISPMHAVIICHEFTSRFNTSLEFADRLARAGHRVTYISHADVGDVVAVHGHAFRRLSSMPADPPRLERPRLRDLVPWVKTSRRLRRATAVDDEIEGVVVGLDPDIVLVDIEMHYAVIAISHLPVPTVLYMNWFCIYRLPDVPPMSSGLVPIGGRENTRLVRRAWQRSRIRTWKRRIRHKLGPGMVGDLLRPISYATYRYADVRAVARARRVPLELRTSRSQWLEPIMFMDLPVLSFTALEMELPHDRHPNMRYVGPMIADRRPVRAAERASLDAWNEFLAVAEASDDRGPMVYCSLGSYLTDVDFLRTVVEAFRHRPDWSLVLGLGRKVTREALGETPTNVLVLDWAPQLDILAVADAAIVHGGSSSVHECIANAVPLLVYPPGWLDLDQRGNAARIEYHGLGLVGRMGPDGPDQIEAHLDRLLSDPSYRSNVRAMQEVFDRYRDAGTAVHTLEQELRSARTDAPD